MDVDGDGKRDRSLGNSGTAPGFGEGEEPGGGEVPPRLVELARIAVQAAKTLAFPLGLALFVLMFLVVQHWLDRNSPKLAHAPVVSRYDVLDFH